MPFVYKFTNPKGDLEEIDVRRQEDFQVVFQSRYPGHQVPKYGEYRVEVRRPTDAERRAARAAAGKNWGPFDPS